jgi:hypothetical protein
VPYRVCTVWVQRAGCMVCVLQRHRALVALAGVTKTNWGMHGNEKVVRVLLWWSWWILTDISRKCKSYYISNISCLGF